MLNLVSSVPGIFSALVGLIQAAAQAFNPPVFVSVYELGSYVPGSYVAVEQVKGLRYSWESLGPAFQQREIYDIAGSVRVFTGDSPFGADDPAVIPLALTTQAFSLFQSCVMGPVMSNIYVPTFGTSGPSANIVLPSQFGYDSGPGHDKQGEPMGWEAVLDWQFHFEAVLTPQ